ncbi:MAG: flagellar hook-associated protein FlgL [Syntrophales bacterium]|nr:flagellar hook-associated protein FlgL [Syntrophales bacterium]
MALRVTDSMKYFTILDNIFYANERYNNVMAKLSSLKEINKISDNPLGASQLLDLKQTENDVDMYSRSINNANTWLKETESKLSSISDLLTRVSEIVMSQVSATANSTSRRIAAQEIQEVYGEILSLANAKLGDRYIFGGSRDDTVPFVGGWSEAYVDTPVGAKDNKYTGSLSVTGAFTGVKNRTIVVRIVHGGNEEEATYKLSTDGGKTWSEESAPGELSDGIDLGEGLVLIFEPGEFAEGDTFYVRAYAPGNFRGDLEEQCIAVSKNAKFSYSISGAEVFTKQGGGKVEVFKLLADIKTALEENDEKRLSELLPDLGAAQNQVNIAIASCGAKMNRLEIAKSSLDQIRLEVSKMISDIQDADVVQLATQLSMKELALKACYYAASRIQEINIMPYLE